MEKLNDVGSVATVLQYLINGASYLLLCPFSIKYDTEQRLFRARSSRWRKVVVAFASVIMVANQGLILNFLLREHPKGFDRIFTIGLLTLWLLLVASVIYTFWFNRDKIMDFINSVDTVFKRVSVPTISGQMLIKISAILLLTFVLAWATLGCLQVMNKCYRDEGSDCSVLKFASQVLRMELDPFFSIGEGSSRVQGAQGVCFFFLLFLTLSSLSLGFGCCMAVSVTCWLLVSEVVAAMRRKGALNMVELLDTLDDLHGVFKSCSDSFSFIYLETCLLYVLMYSVRLPKLGGFDAYNTAEIVFYTISFVLVTIPAASVYSMIRSIPMSLQPFLQPDDSVLRKRNSGQDQRLNLMVQNINAGQFGISGKVFIINYSFLGGICGLVVTYAIVLAPLTASPFD